MAPNTSDVETKRIVGYGSGPYGVGPYGKPSLLIDHGSGQVPRWQTAEQLIDDALTFWHDFFHRYPPAPASHSS